MPDITNAQAVEFTQTPARPLADALSLAYWKSKQAVAEWNATGMSSIITNTSDLIVDGNDKPVTGAQITNVMTRAMELIADYEATDNAKLNTVLQGSNV